MVSLGLLSAIIVGYIMVAKKSWAFIKDNPKLVSAVLL
jgi:uncharacterized protein YneF (UPF0154 family)